MSDKLSFILQSVNDLTFNKKETSDQKLINALDKALKATTPEYAGCPWDLEEEENEQRNPEYWLPQGED